MKFLAALLLAGCATVGDVREVAESVDELATVQAERDERVAEALVAVAAVVSPEVALPLTEVASQLANTDRVRAAGTRAVAAAQAAEDRSGSLLAALLSPNGAAAGVLTLASAVGLNLYRNRTRRKALVRRAT